MNKMKSRHGRKCAAGHSNTGCSSRPTDDATTMSNENNAHGKAVTFRNGSRGGSSVSGSVVRFFNFAATILFATIMIVNVRHSCGLIDIQTEKEKHGE